MPVGEEGKFVDAVTFRRHLRRTRTRAEEVLRENLAGKKLGFKFTEQFKIGEAYVDFCCRSHKVVIEVDGSSHENKLERDVERDKALEEKGYLVVRVTNEEALDHTERVLAEIGRACEGRPQWRY